MGDSDTCKENIKDKIGIEYFDKKDACKIANVSPNTIDNYRKKNIISVKRYGNKNYYSLSDIEILRNNVVINKKNIRKDPVVDNIETVEPKNIISNNNKSSNRSRRSASEIDKLRRIIDDYAEENAVLTKKVNQLTLSIGDKENNLRKHKNSMESFGKEMDSLKTEIAILRKKLNEKNQFISELKENNLELNEEILKAQADIIELTTTRNNAKEAFNKLVGEIKGIVEEASNKSSEIAELKVYKANYIKVLAKIAKLEKEKKAEYDEEVRQLIKVNSDLSEKCDKLMRQVDEYQMLILDKVESKRLGNNEDDNEKKSTFKDNIVVLFDGCYLNLI